MLPRVAALSLPAPFLDRRNANRRTFTLSFDATERPGTTPVSIMDLSQTGMRIRSTANLELGERLEVAIPEAGTVSAVIIRSTRMDLEHEYGAEFVEPISHGAISAALLAAPAPLQPEDMASELDETKLSRRTRMLILAGLTLASWLLVGMIGFAITRLF